MLDYEAMDLEEFIVGLFPERPEDIVVHYRGQKYSTTSEPNLSDVLEELTIDARVLGDLDIILEIPSRKKFFRRRISIQEVSPLALPLEQRPQKMPDVRVIFNSVTLAPEQLVLQRNFSLPVVSWESFSVKIQNQWPPIDSSYGIPFGSYKLEIGLPELPNLRKKTAKISVTLSPDLNLGLSSITSGLFSWNYSQFSWSIEEIEPEAFGVFQLIIDQLENARAKIQSKKLDALFAKEFAEYQRTGIFVDTDYSSILEQTKTEDDNFDAYRNMAGYRYIYFIENSIRHFVWGKLQSIYASETSSDSKWWMGCLPEDVRKHIIEKMSTKNPILDQLKGETIPLHYCSFNELGQIIEKEWLKIFEERPLDRKAFFGHMAYLENIRNAIAHSRPLGNGELQILYSNGNAALIMLGIEIPKTTYRNIIGKFTA